MTGQADAVRGASRDKAGHPRPSVTNFAMASTMATMATMNVSLPDGLKKFVEAQVSERNYGTSSEFIRDLIRREQGRTQLRALLVDGMASGPGSEMDEPYFERMRERARSSRDG